jgi:hypothetical protein
MFSLWKEPAETPAAGNESLAVSRLPICDYCLDWAEFHGETDRSRRANMCSRHFKLKGKGRHQKLVLVHSTGDSRFRPV